jgi:hypothetical protein
MKTNHNLFCSICEKQLCDKQKVFCSKACKSKSLNFKHQNYKNQQKRGLFRKIKLMQTFGAKCGVCEYDKNFSCLTFHHKDPKTKNFCLDLRSCSNRSWESLLEEAAKCELLCNRCHTEHHNPQLDSKSCYEKMNSFIEFNEDLYKNKKIECGHCNKIFHPKKYSQKFCSEECYKISSRKIERPSIQQLKKDLSELSCIKVGKKYGVSDNTIRKWIKQYENTA